jgi:hypothetical protein
VRYCWGKRDLFPPSFPLVSPIISGLFPFYYRSSWFFVSASRLLLLTVRQSRWVWFSYLVSKLDILSSFTPSLLCALSSSSPALQLPANLNHLVSMPPCVDLGCENYPITNYQKPIDRHRTAYHLSYI